MGKAPASQFYWGDLRRDAEYHLMDWASRGIWVEMLTCMHFSKERGKLEGTPEQLSRLIGCTIEEFEAAIKQIRDTKTGDVTENETVENSVEIPKIENPSVTKSLHVTPCNRIVTIINRRMFREERERILTRSRVQKYRNTQEKRSCNEEVTPPSPSPSPIHNNKDSKNVEISRKYYKTERGNFVCYQCQKEFTFWKNLQDHFEEHKTVGS